jgi:signal transduction histidine kinase
MGISKAIYPRILVPFVLALGTGSLAAWWLAASLFENSLQEQRRHRLNDAIGVLARGNLPLTPDLLARLGKLLQANLYLISKNGEVTDTSPSSSNPAAQDTIEQVLGSQNGFDYSAIYRIGGQRFSILVQPLGQSASGAYAAIAAVAGLAEQRTASGQMALRLGLGVIAGGLLLSWLVHRIALGITRPISRLSHLAEQLATGNLQARVSIDKPREVAMLADSLNRMATQLQEYQQKTVEQNRLQALGEMAARIAHEIRNPLTAIKLQLQLLAESLSDDDKNTADTLLNEVLRLELIVGSTLQAGGGSDRITLMPVDLNTLVDGVVRMFQPQFAHRGIRLERRLHHHLPQAMLDPNRLKQVLANLLVNAAEALNHGGLIRVTTEHRVGEAELALAVDDTGPGIPAERRANLFSEQASNKTGGLGIGLRLSRELVEQQGGRISVVESALGGARFLAIFPLENGK